MYHALSDAVRIARDMADGAAAGGVTSLVMMPDTDPVIDDVAPAGSS